MKTRRAARAALIILLAVAVSFAGCNRNKKEQDGQGGPGGMQGRGGGPPAVQIAPAAAKSLVLVKEYVGEIRPYQSVDVRSTASGWLTAINVDAGDRVAPGDALCVIEHQDIQAQADQARASITVAQAAVARAAAELERVVLETRRVETLHEKGYAAKRDLEQVQAAEKQARAAVDSARGQLAQANAQLKNIQVKLGDATVRAPFSGTVSQRFVDPGAYVSPSTPILTIVDDASVKAVVNAVEEDFPRLTLGAQAEITADAFPGETFQGRITRIPPAVDAVSRTAAVEIRIENKPGKLRTGMTVRVGLVIAEVPQALAVPEAALKKDVEAGTQYVFILENGKAARRDVEAGIAAQGFVEIRGGVSPGAQVIISTSRLNDGMKVRTGGPRGGPRK